MCTPKAEDKNNSLRLFISVEIQCKTERTLCTWKEISLHFSSLVAEGNWGSEALSAFLTFTRHSSRGDRADHLQTKPIQTDEDVLNHELWFLGSGSQSPAKHLQALLLCAEASGQL